MDIYHASASCIEEIHTEDDVVSDLSIEEKTEFIENLSLGEFEGFKEFFSTMPVLEKEIEFTCKNKECGKTSTFYMNGYLDFFV